MDKPGDTKNDSIINLVACPECDGHGRWEDEADQWENGWITRTVTIVCSGCHGDGLVEPCPHCYPDGCANCYQLGVLFPNP